ncbi:DMT family transporter [Sporolactobacillus inulinus]|uniref:Membrane protein n=1 Tax=Sporolactobacillus inulinus CASD TaxID=1069536 RepID=A0A0U1QL43_9BACL|nr:DMT family transporter [Sporolactobacillus inulinus]KLI01513.1 membrane protein [Sporolactobacillus inulinus CASD]GEB78258.1 membrane protein [Sporolactobacillus inulinus]
MILLFLIGGLIAGSVIPVQASINSRLGREVGSPFLASFISFFTGTLTLIILALVIDHRLLVAPHTLLNHPWWLWIGGGMIGVFYLTTNILLLPRLGAALTIVVTLVGQMIMAIAIDQFGWFHVPIHTLSLPRLIGILCMLLGVLLIKKF